jgi:UDP-N-acetylglucosamine transferase subunit ALG13
MIFVTVGNDFRNFNRLLIKLDEIAQQIPDEILIQRGYSDYQPENIKYFDFVPIEKAIEYIQTSRLVVSHAGIGTIFLCKKYGTPLIILPRRKIFREHMNDHQLEVAKALEERGDENISVIYEVDRLEEKILESLKGKPRHRPTENVGRINLIRTLKEFLQTI